MTDIGPQLQRLTEELAVPEQTVSLLQRATERPFPIDTARYQFTLTVLWAFLIFIVVIILTIEASYDKDKVSTLIDILKTMLLPLVTLMIGHYFGAKSQS